MKKLKQYINWLLSILTLLKIYVLRPKNIKIAKFKISLNSKIKFDSKSNININNIKLVNSTLIIRNSTINIEDLKIENCFILIENSTITILSKSEINGYTFSLQNSFFISQAHLNMTKSYAHHALLKCENGNINFGENVNIHACIAIRDGNLNIGNNVFINHDTELRSEKAISIGNNVLISTDCIIYDTNTHSTNYLDRQQELIDGYPNGTFQNPSIRSRVSKKEISIGNDVWIGKKAAILKGAIIEDQAIVALGTVITGRVPKQSIAVGNPATIKANINI